MTYIPRQFFEFLGTRLSEREVRARVFFGLARPQRDLVSGPEVFVEPAEGADGIGAIPAGGNPRRLFAVTHALDVTVHSRSTRAGATELDHHEVTWGLVQEVLAAIHLFGESVTRNTEVEVIGWERFDGDTRPHAARYRIRVSWPIAITSAPRPVLGGGSDVTANPSILIDGEEAC